MRIPAQQLVHGLYRRTGKDAEQNFKNEEEQVYWNILLKSKGDIEVDITTFINLYKQFKSGAIVTIVYLFASGSEINLFMEKTNKLLTNDELNKLDQALKNREHSQQIY